MWLQLPIVRQLQPGMIADRPIVMGALDRVRQRLALGMALYAGVVRLHEILAGGIEDVDEGGMRGMGAARAMTHLAADIPFGWQFGVEIVVDRVAPVAERSSGTIGIVTLGIGIIRRPPVAVFIGHVIFRPLFGGKVEL